ncbi:hypothetical protein HYS03_00210 [Candidatus Woesebacteria bacterium]|nr:hypothetical protein [Candidatus Woesebacteria bacterium]QQG47381.1 MAG: hypothetical protein HY044_04630 [Candidatus Woesebacteria bacterium]
MATIFQSPTKVASSARDQAIKAARAVAKTSFETTKSMGQDVVRQTTGMENLQQEGATKDQDKQIEIQKMQDEQYRVKRYQELKAELDQALLEAQQKRLQQKEQWSQIQTQVMEIQPKEQTQITTNEKPKGPFGGMKKAVKSMYDRATSKERKGGGGA